jgi:hypothetical protein
MLRSLRYSLVLLDEAIERYELSKLQLFCAFAQRRKGILLEDKALIGQSEQ